MDNEWNKIFNVNEGNFIDLALEIFQFQYQHNPIYKTYVDTLRFNPKKINKLPDIPFLPIGFFKTHRVKTTDFDPGYEFESSGTTQTGNSHHFIKDIEIYRRSFTTAFELLHGPVQSWCIIGLLPSYLERKNSSLVFMADELIRKSGHAHSGFYLDEFEKLSTTLKDLEEKKQKTLLIGVTFALLDFATEYSFPLKHTTIMETGGMKGRREELVRDEVHEVLKRKFQVEVIHSEYGMTELLSQAYSKGNGIFNCPPWMKVLVRDEEDPLEIRSAVGDRQSDSSFTIHHSPFTTHELRPSAKGILNIIDLANIYSCSFIATDDAGKLYDDGSFEVIGRVDNSDIRGCSLMSI
ncbi:MAG TPA: acyl transferase [Chitinophagaceae bacterium]|jgi:hypothetical protein|nr:acyl transferase [Chitinophagaceae bacterium]